MRAERPLLITPKLLRLQEDLLQGSFVRNIIHVFSFFIWCCNHGWRIMLDWAGTISNWYGIDEIVTVTWYFYLDSFFLGNIQDFRDYAAQGKLIEDNIKDWWVISLFYSFILINDFIWISDLEITNKKSWCMEVKFGNKIWITKFILWNYTCICLLFS